MVIMKRVSKRNLYNIYKKLIICVPFKKEGQTERRP